MLKDKTNYKNMFTTYLLICGLLIGDIFNIFALELISVSIISIIISLVSILFIWSIIYLGKTAEILNGLRESEIETFENEIGYKLYRPINRYTLVLSKISNNKKRGVEKSIFNIDNPFGNYLNFINTLMILTALFLTGWNIIGTIYGLYILVGVIFHHIILENVNKHNIQDFYEKDSN